MLLCYTGQLNVGSLPHPFGRWLRVGALADLRMFNYKTTKVHCGQILKQCAGSYDEFVAYIRRHVPPPRAPPHPMHQGPARIHSQVGFSLFSVLGS